jgi:hypothetical protein
VLQFGRAISAWMVFQQTAERNLKVSVLQEQSLCWAEHSKAELERPDLKSSMVVNNLKVPVHIIHIHSTY